MTTIRPQSDLAKQVTQLNPMYSETGTNSESLLVDNVNVSDNTGDVKTSTAIFVDDAAVVTRDSSSWATPSKELYETNVAMESEQSIKDFLAKPVTLLTGTFATTDTLTTITSISSPYAIFATVGNLWRNKISGYFGIRMTMNFRIVVNANRFQQGRYIMSFTHFAGASTNGTKTQLVNSNLRLPTLVQRTTVPHVELDLNCDTAAELSIPYVSVRTFYPVHELLNVPAGEQTTLGFLNLYPYSPLVTVAGSTTAPYRVYCWLTDVELIGAASPQSGLPRKEVANKSNGVLSGPLGAVSRGFKEFESIPLLSTYAHSVSWISDRLSRTAAMFGLSKPLQGDSLLKINPLSAPSHTTVDGDSDARSLATISQPGVLAVEGLSGNKFDEMDFAYITQKFAWFSTVNWTTGSLIDASLAVIGNSPFKPLMAGAIANHPPVSFVSDSFISWRGGLKYRFKFVKTEFHSGRIAIDYFPSLPTITNTGSPEYVNRVIVDIREHSEIEIVIPYVSNTMYTERAASTGVIILRVIDPLVAPATVSSTVNILMEVAGCSDFEVYGPCRPQTPIGIVPQSGLGEDCKIFSSTLGKMSLVSNPTLASSVSAGEKVSNFRALLKRFTPLRHNVLVAPTIDNVVISILSDAIPIRASTAAATYIESDYYGLIASCYAIAGGGQRIRDVIAGSRLTKQDSPAQVVYQTVLQASSNYMITGTIVSPTTVDSHNNMVIQESKHNGVVTVEIPQYSNYIGKATSDLFMEENSITMKYNPSPIFGTGNKNTVIFVIASSNAPILPPVATAGLHNIYRSGADDSNFYNFVSVPPLSLNSTAVWSAGY